MTPSPDTVMRAWFDELWNQGRSDTIDRLLAEDGRAHGLGPAPIVGRAQFHAFYQQFRQGFPDVHVKVTHAVTEGDMVTVYCHVTGTHTGPGWGSPSGAPVDFRGFCMARVRDGQMVEGWNTFDFLTCYQQIGLLPQLPA